MQEAIVKRLEQSLNLTESESQLLNTVVSESLAELVISQSSSINTNHHHQKMDHNSQSNSCPNCNGSKSNSENKIVSDISDCDFVSAAANTSNGKQSRKQLTAQIENYFQHGTHFDAPGSGSCQGTCSVGQSTTSSAAATALAFSGSGFLAYKFPNQNVKHHQMKMRLKEKSKKKLEEKGKIIQETGDNQSLITQADNQGNISKKIQTNASLNGKTPQPDTLNMTTTTQKSLPTTNPLEEQEREQEQQTQQDSNSNSENKKDDCNKHHDCPCNACIKRRKIADELIRQEEKEFQNNNPSKNPNNKNDSNKQNKKKKKKDKQQKAADNSNKQEQSFVSTGAKQENDVNDNTNRNNEQTSKLINNTDNQQKSNASTLTTTAPTTSSKSKKNKKNKQSTTTNPNPPPATSEVNEPKVIATSASNTTTSMSKKNKEKEQPKDKEKSSKQTNKDSKERDQKTTNNNNNGTADSTFSTNQSWIKVKNSKNNKQNSKDSGTDAALPSGDNVLSVSDDVNDDGGGDDGENYDDEEEEENNGEYDPEVDNDFYVNTGEDEYFYDGNEDDDDDEENDGFKVIGQNDHKNRRMSSNENFSSNNGQTSFSNNNDSLQRQSSNMSSTGNNANNVNQTSMQIKAKLMAIEAQIAYDQNELKGALKYISEALELDPNNPIYYINRAFYNIRLYEYEHALKDTDSAIRFFYNYHQQQQQKSTTNDSNKSTPLPASTTTITLTTEHYQQYYLYLDYALCLKAKSLTGLGQFEQAETLLMNLIQQQQIRKQRMMATATGNQQQQQQSNSSSMIMAASPRIQKDLMLLRMKKLISLSYTVPLARLYAKKYPTIQQALNALEKNCKLLLRMIPKNQQQMDEKLKLNESDPKLHLLLILQQQKHDSEDLNNNNPLQFLDEQDTKFMLQQEQDPDEEIYFSDEDEHEQWYLNAENWNEPKDLLQHRRPLNFEDTKEPPNSKGQKALWIGNVSPNCSLAFVSSLFMKYGQVTFCKIFTNNNNNSNSDQQQTTQRATTGSGDVAYLLLHYDNDISPRLVMAYFKDKIVPGISKDDTCPLLIRFRNKNDKIDESSTIGTGGTGTATTPDSGNSIVVAVSPSTSLKVSHVHPSSSPLSSSGNATGNSNNTSSNSNSNQSSMSECYYWRTTGCDRQHCTFKHVQGNKGVDKQAWMRKKH